MTEIRIEHLTTSIEEVDEDERRFLELFALHIARHQQEMAEHERAHRISEDERRLDSVVERQRDPWGEGW